MVLALSAPVALAAPPSKEGCEKIKGKWVCTTTDLPGESDTHTQGTPPETTVTDETQGNLTNKNPEPQHLKDNECDPDASPGLCKQAQNA